MAYKIYASSLRKFSKLITLATTTSSSSLLFFTRCKCKQLNMGQRVSMRDIYYIVMYSWDVVFVKKNLLLEHHCITINRIKIKSPTHNVQLAKEYGTNRKSIFHVISLAHSMMIQKLSLKLSLWKVLIFHDGL